MLQSIQLSYDYAKDRALMCLRANYESRLRKVVAARSDGEGNRSGKGMETNSILFTNMVTDWLADRSFFDHMVLAASGDG